MALSTPKSWLWLLVSALVLTLPDASGATDVDVLYVAGALPLDEADGNAVLEMEVMGFSVTAMDDDAVTAGDASGRDLVFVSPTVSYTAVGTKFTAVSVPVVSSHWYTFANLGMTGPIEGTDFGRANSQATVDALGGHPLSGGPAGVRTLRPGGLTSRVAWGAPGAAAQVGVTISGDPTKAASFGYEAGSLMVGVLAPARRAGLFLDSRQASRWTADTQDLFRASVLWAIGEELDDRIRVATIGDSITWGVNGYWSFRRPLSVRFRSDACRIDMTGTLVGPDTGTPGPFLYDRDNEGHSGWRTDEVAAELAGWLQGSEPDIAIVHLGTNDVHEGTSLTDAKEHLRTSIGHLRAANPDVVILLAQIIPHRESKEDEIQELNGYIADLAAEEDTAQSPIVLVDQYTGYDRDTMSAPDGFHPNDFGEQQIANRFFYAMRPYLRSHCALNTHVPAMGATGHAILLALAIGGGLGATARLGRRAAAR